MSCSWSRSYALLGGFPGTITCANLPNSCGNWCSNLSGAGGNLLSEFGCGVTSTAQAIEILTNEVAKRLGNAQVQFQGLSSTSWKATWKLGLEACEVGTAIISANTVNGYPISVRWERSSRGTSGVASFQTSHSVIDFLVQQFKQ